MPRARRRYLQVLARAGYAARALVFVILAGFTAVAAIDARAQPVDGKDALRALLLQPFGSALLAIVAVGLVCFALWRAAQSILDADRLGSEIKGVARRVVHGGASLFYLGFAFVAFSMLVGVHTSSTERVVHDWTGRLLSAPFGDVAVGAIGVAIMVSGLGMGITGVRADFCDRFALNGKPRRWVTALGTAGYLARAVVIALIGLFVLFAALDANAHEATGVAGALLAIKHQTYGGVLLAATALGLLAFGAYGLAEALYRRVDGQSVLSRLPAWMSA
jgi:hypothetical protein